MRACEFFQNTGSAANAADIWVQLASVLMQESTYLSGPLQSVQVQSRQAMRNRGQASPKAARKPKAENSVQLNPASCFVLP